jgi:hypothetical protein
MMVFGKLQQKHVLMAVIVVHARLRNAKKAILAVWETMLKPVKTASGKNRKALVHMVVTMEIANQRNAHIMSDVAVVTILKFAEAAFGRSLHLHANTVVRMAIVMIPQWAVARVPQRAMWLSVMVMIGKQSKIVTERGVWMVIVRYATKAQDTAVAMMPGLAKTMHG